MVSISPECLRSGCAFGWVIAGKGRLSPPLPEPLIYILTIISPAVWAHQFRRLLVCLTRNQPLLYPTTDVIDTFVYRAPCARDVGMSSAGFFSIGGRLYSS